MGDRHGFFEANATNYRFSDILAAVGVAQLEKADEIIGRRREIAAMYDKLLAEDDGITIPRAIEGGEHNYQCYCVYVEAGGDDLRDQLIADLDERNIETQIGTHALSNTDAFGDARRGGDLSTAKALAKNLLTLPVAHSMTNDDQRRVVDALESAIEDRT
jgi:perosamine synthetase